MKRKEIVVGYVWPGRHQKGDNPFDLYDEDEFNAEMKAHPVDEVILPVGKYTLLITYPLTNHFKQEFGVFEKGMTRQAFVDYVCKAYQEIYKAEDEDEGAPTGLIPGMLNRKQSAGRYGIWGHGIGDLTIHTLYLDANNVITLGVDS